MKKFLLTLVIPMAAAACNPAAKTPEEDAPNPTPAGSLSVQRLDSALHNYYRHSSGLPDSARLVIRNRDEWADIWSRIVSNHGPTPPAPEIDFSREVVLVAAMGTRSSGGFSIAITNVAEEAGGLVATVVSTSPGPTCGTTAALTAPVDIVRVSRPSVAVRFVEQQAVHDCG